jgi:hypothetical protein
VVHAPAAFREAFGAAAVGEAAGRVDTASR